MKNLSDEEEEDSKTLMVSNNNSNKRKAKVKKDKNTENKKLLKGKIKSKINLPNKESININKISSNYIFKKIRNTYIISEDAEGNPILTIGPDWIYSSLLSIIITICFTFLFFKYNNFMPFYLIYSGIIIYAIFIFVHTKLFISNPGYPKKIDINLVKKKKKNYTYCSICNSWFYKNYGIKHCEICEMCIEKYDHHCIWIGKCIGKENFFLFFFFMVWIVMVFVYFIAAFVIVHNNIFEYQKQLKHKKI